MYEYKQVPIYGEAPVYNSGYPSAAEVLNRHAAEGWEHWQTIAGSQNENVPAECKSPMVYVFRRLVSTPQPGATGA